MFGAERTRRLGHSVLRTSTAGVAAGDPAEIELELNGSGQYETLKSLTIEGEVTSVSIRVNAAITQTLLVTYLIGGADT